MRAAHCARAMTEWPFFEGDANVSDNTGRPGEKQRDDLYSRVDYRRLVAWPQRIEREWPFLRRALGAGGRILDLGCGTGEHSRFLASKGFDVVGIDASPAMLAKATDTPLPANLRFVEGDIADVERAGGRDVRRGDLPGEHPAPRRRHPRACSGCWPGCAAAAAAGRAVRAAGPELRARSSRRGQRFLPLNFRAGDRPGEEIVFLRLMTPHEDGTRGLHALHAALPAGRRSAPRGRVDPQRPAERLAPAGTRGTARRRGLQASATLFGTVGDAPYSASRLRDLVIVAARQAV